MCAQKLTSSQLNLGDGTKKQENNEKDKKTNTDMLIVQHFTMSQNHQ